MFRSACLLACACLTAAMSVLCAAAANVPAPIPMEQTLILRVDGQLTIGPQGVPIEYQIKTTVPQSLRDSLQRTVHSWRFEPVLLSGKPVVAQTQMRVTLAAQVSGDAYRVAADNVTFPQTRGEATDAIDDPESPVVISISRRNTADYPRAALEYGITANVLVNLRLTPEGRVAQSFVTQIALLNVKGSEKDLRIAAELFERQVLTDVKDWRFRVVVDQAKLAGLQTTHPEAVTSAFTVRVPIEFRMQGSLADRNSSWQSEARTPLRPAPWLPPDPARAAIGVADLDTGELAPASNPRFRLSTPVAGTVL